MKGIRTEQEKFWVGKFGDDYIERSNRPYAISSNIALFSRIFSRTKSIDSVIEFGANLGRNLVVIKELMPHAELSAVEINQKAVEKLK
tara:strand:- start:130 stop:393 length:264 start_codon:yes stop_codon:yes gene_type:complete